MKYNNSFAIFDMSSPNTAIPVAMQVSRYFTRRYWRTFRDSTHLRFIHGRYTDIASAYLPVSTTWVHGTATLCRRLTRLKTARRADPSMLKDTATAA